MATLTAAPPKVRHEEFCVDAEPRIEQFVAYKDGLTGRSVPTLTVTRCMECGAAKYTDIT